MSVFLFESMGGCRRLLIPGMGLVLSADPGQCAQSPRFCFRKRSAYQKRPQRLQRCLAYPAHPPFRHGRPNLATRSLASASSGPNHMDKIPPAARELSPSSPGQCEPCSFYSLRVSTFPCLTCLSAKAAIAAPACMHY
jgi:hypothetical protein